MTEDSNRSATERSQEPDDADQRATSAKPQQMSTPEKRTGWLETWSEMARVVARRSRCSRAQVGAVIVTAENRIAATGYNGPPRGYSTLSGPCKNWCLRGECGPTKESATSYDDCPSLHAELNALMHSSRSERDGGTIYVTGHLCLSCAKAVANSGLSTVVIVGAEDIPHRQPARSIAFLQMCGLKVVEV